MTQPAPSIFTLASALVLAVALALPAAPAPAPDGDGNRPTAAGLEFFEKRVRPILVARCYECHSATAEKVRGGLLLDSRDGWARGGESGPAVVPGRPDRSLLVHAVRRHKQDLEMPPTGRLPEAEIAALEQWVKLGAPDPRIATPTTTSQPPAGNSTDGAGGRDHWAYRPLRPAAPPAVRDESWPAGDVDRFILAELESRGLRPAPEADRPTLVRRLYFDLHGLPPTPEQVAGFVKDESPRAYERLVDELLASPRFGERWGRHWLDVARFGESLTLRGFVLTGAWRYRDYVIDAFNEDRPFDAFVREQVAGDLMPAESVAQRRRQLVATAFLAIGNTNLEEQDKKQLRMDAVDEQLEAVCRAFLAQSVGCARCHDHKFDPIPTRDYYAMAGILRSTRTMEHANVSKWMEVPLPEEPDRERQLAEHEAAVAALRAKLDAAKAELARAGGGAGGALEGVVVDDGAAKLVGSWKKSTHTAGYVGAGYVHDENAGKGAKTATFIPDLPRSGVYEVRVSHTPGDNRASNVPVTVFGAGGEKTVLVDQRRAAPIGGRFVSLGHFPFEKAGQSFVIVSNENTDGHVIADAVQFIPADEAAETPATASSGSSAADQVRRMEAELKALAEKGPKRQTIVAVVEEAPAEVGDTRVHVRGSVHTLGAPAPRGFLSAVPVRDPPQVPAGQSGRLQLAQWLTRPDNPLTPRVWANRTWHWLFGSGIVRTADNFGTTGEAPSHPELLDYLATRFVERGWSVKSLVREIVLSRAYRMSSSPPSDGAAAAIDPENRLLWRTNRRRLDAECIRDAALSVGAGLDLAVGGLTYPPGLSSDFGYAYSGNRRSVYVPAFRNALPELFEAFDFADPSTPTGVRNASTVAPQALFMLNNPFVRDQARHAARRLLGETHPHDAARAVRAYFLALGRAPTDGELRAVREHLGRRGAGRTDEDAWADVFHALIASPEFRYID